MARARRRWIREQGLLDTTHLVFIDETSVNTNMIRLFGRAPRGERVIGRVPFSAWKTVTFVAALRHDGMTAPMMIKGAMIRRGLSGLCRLMPGADAQTRRYRGDGQCQRSQSRRCARSDRSCERDATLSAAVLSGPQSDRAALQRLQGIPAQVRRAYRGSTSPPHRTVRAAVARRSLRQLLRTRRICCKMSGICSKKVHLRLIGLAWIMSS